jgi:4-amino-4-deoxy-L-arabinose transferase-like glycosyltransferase
VYAAVAVLVLGSGLITSWNIGNSGYSAFYSTAARSMTLSWRAFTFGAFDPRASITLDKLAGFLVPQALAARAFGFHPWTIALPQVIEGMVTVAIGYLIGFRWRGIAAGLFAATALASTPLLASMFGHVMEDGLLTMSLALALLCLQSAVSSGRLLPLLGSAFWIAVGFQAKMMQAWLVLPAFALGYLLGAPNPLLQRLRRGLLAGVLAVVLSLAWMTAIQLTPAADRPYIDGSTDNNVYSMVFGYNGFNRLIPDLVPGAIGDPQHLTASAQQLLGGPPQLRQLVRTSASNDFDKLIQPHYATQVGWLYPLALAGLLFEIWPFVAGRRRRGRALKSGALGCTLALWLATSAAVLSLAAVPHTAYLSALSIQVALLSAAAMVRAVRLYRLRDPRGRLLLPGLVALETGWSAGVLVTSRVAPPWLLPTVLTIGLGAAVALVIPVTVIRADKTRSGGRRWTTIAIAAGLVSVLIAPLVWTAFTLDPARDGSAADAYAGPGPANSRQVAARPAMRNFRIPPPFQAPPDPRLTSGQQRLVQFLRQHDRPGEPLMVTDQWLTASPYILNGGLDVLSMGGYSGEAPTPTLSGLERLIAKGILRYVLLTNFYHRTGRNPDVLAIRTWVRGNCSVVPAAEYGGPSHSLLGQRLYSCGGEPTVRPARTSSGRHGRDLYSRVARVQR